MSEQTIKPITAPAYLSAEARAFIEQPIVKTPYPERSDTAAWTALIETLDSYIAGALPQLDLPLHSEQRAIGGVPSFVITPAEADAAGPVFLDAHAGALILGGGDLVRRMGEFSSLQTGIVHWAPDYRMPPLHPFPAALDDMLAVYEVLLEERSPHQIIVGGGSAGGNLAAALLLRARDKGLPMPAGLVLQTPEVDLTESGDSFRTLADVSVGLQSLEEVNDLYAAGVALDDPFVSPLFADLVGFPPTLLIGGTRDLFLSNTVRMHRRLREAGVSADLHIFDARPHAGFGAAPEEAAVAGEVRRFVREVLGF